MVQIVGANTFKPRDTLEFTPGKKVEVSVLQEINFAVAASEILNVWEGTDKHRMEYAKPKSTTSGRTNRIINSVGQSKGNSFTERADMVYTSVEITN